jgi:hypothetical protein
VLTSDAAHFDRNVERYQPAQLFRPLEPGVVQIA